MVVNKEGYIIYSFYNEDTTLENDKNTEGTFIYKPKENKIEKILADSFSQLTIDSENNIYGAIWPDNKNKKDVGLYKIQKNLDNGQYTANFIETTKNMRIVTISIAPESNNVYFGAGWAWESNSWDGMYKLEAEGTIKKLIPGSVRIILAVSDEEIYYGNYDKNNKDVFLYTSEKVKKQISAKETISMNKIGNQLYFGKDILYKKDLSKENEGEIIVSKRYYRKVINDGRYLYGGYYITDEN